MSSGISHKQAIAIAFIAILALVLPAELDDYQLAILTRVFLTATVGIAWNLMMGYAGQLSLGHALYFGVGAYVLAILTQRYGVSPWIALVPTAAIPGLLGIAVGAVGFRFSVRGVYFALLTIAFAEMALIGFEHWDFVGKSGGFFLSALTPRNVPLISLRGGATFNYYVLLAFLALAWLISFVLVRGRLGYFWRAIREDEDASRAMGVRAFRYKLLVIGVSSAITGVAGGWFALINGSLFPDEVLGLRVSIDLVVAPIVGGLGTLFGPILGALMIVPVNEFSRTLAQSLSINGLNLLAYGLLLMAIARLAPHGCWPPLARLLRLEPRGK